jgi:hypothetical protein
VPFGNHRAPSHLLFIGLTGHAGDALNGAVLLSVQEARRGKPFISLRNAK